MARQTSSFSETPSQTKHTSSQPDQKIKESLNKRNFNSRLGRKNTNNI
jgi:hypothetical protein